MQQYLIPPTEYQHCEECFKTVTTDLARKSKERCNGRILCFKHQMFYTSQQYRFKRLAKSQPGSHKKQPKNRAMHLVS